MQSGGRAKPVRLLCGVASAALVAAVLVLATASPAHAHAVPLHIEPPPGATLATAPSAVYVTFDSPVRVGPRNAAVRNDGVDVLAGKPRVTSGDRLVIPLRHALDSGSYSVRWSVVSDDGHEEEGVIAFGIGLLAKLSHAFSVNGDFAAKHHFFSGPPRSDAGVRDDLLNALFHACRGGPPWPPQTADKTAIGPDSGAATEGPPLQASLSSSLRSLPDSEAR